MADLPEDRVEPTPPFTYCGMDCFGPFTAKERGKELKKDAEIVTCLSMPERSKEFRAYNAKSSLTSRKFCQGKKFTPGNNRERSSFWQNNFGKGGERSASST